MPVIRFLQPVFPIQRTKRLRNIALQGVSRLFSNYLIYLIIMKAGMWSNNELYLKTMYTLQRHFIWCRVAEFQYLRDDKTCRPHMSIVTTAREVH